MNRIDQELEHYRTTPLNPEWNEGQRFGFSIGDCDWRAEKFLVDAERKQADNNLGGLAATESPERHCSHS